MKRSRNRRKWLISWRESHRVNQFREDVPLHLFAPSGGGAMFRPAGEVSCRTLDLEANASANRGAVFNTLAFVLFCVRFHRFFILPVFHMLRIRAAAALRIAGVHLRARRTLRTRGRTPFMCPFKRDRTLMA
jgi:hypothetical protein